MRVLIREETGELETVLAVIICESNDLSKAPVVSVSKKLLPSLLSTDLSQERIRA